MGNNNVVINALLKLHIVLCLVFIFAPILGSFVFSLNSDRFPSLPLGSFSWEWYRLIWEDPLVWSGFFNTVIVGLSVAVIATILGFGGGVHGFPVQLYRQVFLYGACPSAADDPCGDHGPCHAGLPVAGQPVGQCLFRHHRTWRHV
jgi:hypothetical protein